MTITTYAPFTDDSLVAGQTTVNTARRLLGNPAANAVQKAFRDRGIL